MSDIHIISAENVSIIHFSPSVSYGQDNFMTVTIRKLVNMLYRKRKSEDYINFQKSIDLNLAYSLVYDLTYCIPTYTSP